MFTVTSFRKIARREKQQLRRELEQYAEDKNDVGMSYSEMMELEFGEDWFEDTLEYPDIYDDYYEDIYCEEPYDDYDDDDWYLDDWVDEPIARPGQHILLDDGRTVIVTEDYKYVNILTGEYVKYYGPVTVVFG